MIKVKNVTKKYGKFVAVDDISFEIEKGEIVGLLGPNGAGKSTTMNMITGYIEKTAGEIFIDEHDISKSPKKARKLIGYMPENTPLYKDLTVTEFITYMAELKMVEKSGIKQEVEKVLKDAKIYDVKNKLIRNLSRGYKQRVSLAGALVGNPEILILDEPTVGLDPKQITDIRNLIKEIGKEHTVILSTHILSEVSQLCKKVIIIDKGKIVAIDTPKNLEEKVTKDNSVLVTVEDEKDELEQVVKEMNIKEIKLISENDDNTKQYMISGEEGKDIRKEMFEKFAKKGITIFEMRKIENSLEDAFIKLTQKEETNKTDDNKEKNGKKNKGGNKEW